MEKFVMLGEKGGKIKKNEYYTVPQFVKLILPRWVARLFGVEKKIIKMIENDRD